MTGGVLFMQLFLRGDIVRVNLGHARSECYIKKKEDAKKLEDIFQHFIEGQLQGTQRWMDLENVRQVEKCHHRATGINGVSHDKRLFLRFPPSVRSPCTHPDFVGRQKCEDNDCGNNIPPFWKVIKDALPAELV